MYNSQISTRVFIVVILQS